MPLKEISQDLLVYNVTYTVVYVLFGVTLQFTNNHDLDHEILSYLVFNKDQMKRCIQCFPFKTNR